MKILYILSGTGVKGGASKSFLAMAKAVKEAGNEIAVVAPDGNGMSEVMKGLGWSVLTVPYAFCSLPHLSLTAKDIIRFVPRLINACICNLRARKKVASFASRWGAEIIHENTSVTDIGHHVAKRLGLPHVIHVREYGGRDFHLVLPWIKERLGAPFAYLAAITPELADFRGKDALPGHVRTIYNGVVDRVRNDLIEKKAPYFLYAGRIDETKGVGDLVRAYVDYVEEVRKRFGEGWKDRTLRLKLAGGWYSDGYQASLSRIVESKGLNEFVEWLGPIDDMKPLYAEAAATVIPSKCEGFGRVMPEAMAEGSLCVVRNAGGLAVQLTNGRTATGREIALSFNTKEQLTDCMRKISDAYFNGSPYAEGGEFRKMIEDSRKVVGDLYSCEANGRNVLNYYDYILKDRK